MAIITPAAMAVIPAASSASATISARASARGGAAGGGFGPGRKLGSADLQLLLLALLAEKPSHGYELIKAVEERSSGYYSPSPGMVYPALTYLEEIGHASVAPRAPASSTSATETGRNIWRTTARALDTLLAQLQQIGRRMQKVRRALQPEDAPGEAVTKAIRATMLPPLNCRWPAMI